MKTRLRSTIALAAVVGAAYCGGDPSGPISALPRALSPAELKLIEADNDFALKLYRELHRQAPAENFFISPLSIALALGMTYNGADGTTLQGMTDALELHNMSIEEVNQAYRDLIDLLFRLDPAVEFHLANSIWYREGMTFEQAFLDANREYFHAQVSALDFGSPQAAQTINDWVSDNTAGKIENIVRDPIAPDLVMFLINAVYFRGDWTSQFDKSLTRDALFTLADGTQKQVETMFHAEEADVRSYSDDLVDVVDLAYGGDAFSMTILVPRTGVPLDDVVASLDGQRWRALTSGLVDGATVVGLPKFTLEYEIELNDVLAALGMGDAFIGGVANFSNLRRQNDLYISAVTHKTFIEVDEEGSEAAAATVVAIGETSVGPTPFLVNRPFLFVIRERFSGTILFMGKVLDPDS